MTDDADDGVARPWNETEIEFERCDCSDDAAVKIGVGQDEEGAPFATYECTECRNTWDQYEHWSLREEERTNYDPRD